MRGFLIEYHRRRGTVSVEEIETLEAATIERLKRDRYPAEDDLEIVAIGSSGEDQPRRSHSRYIANEIWA